MVLLGSVYPKKNWKALKELTYPNGCFFPRVPSRGSRSWLLKLKIIVKKLLVYVHKSIPWKLGDSARGNSKESVILLVVQKSGVHKLRLVVFPIIYRVLYIPTVVGNGISEPATVSHSQSLKDPKSCSSFHAMNDLLKFSKLANSFRDIPQDISGLHLAGYELVAAYSFSFTCITLENPTWRWKIHYLKMPLPC